MEYGLRSKYLSPFSKPFRDVLNGDFPEDVVNKMSSCKLEAFVLRLVEYTSAEARANIISMVKYQDKLRWWPKNVLIQELSNKQKKENLRELVIKCCEFFRNSSSSYKQKWLPNTKTAWVNDENFDGIKTRGVKRKISGPTLLNSVKKRKTLLSKNECILQTVSDKDSLVQETITRPVEAVVCLEDILQTPKKDKPLNQQQFLKCFGLNWNKNHTPTTCPVPQFSRILKLHNCPYIPLSSDVGKAIIKRENYSVPEYSTARKLERLEWYINRESPRKSPQEYEVSFVENKFLNYHYFRFPKRQFHQRGNLHYTEFLLQLCKPLSVVLEREDLALIKKQYDNFKLTVQVNKLSPNQVNKYLCKNLKVVIRPRIRQKTANSNSVISNTRLQNRLRLGLRPSIPVKIK